MVDYALGVDVPAGDWRFNVQYYGRWLEEHVPALMADRHEQGVTLQVVHGAGTNLEAEVLALSSINRSDHLIRPKLTWKFAPAWRLVGGVDVVSAGMEGGFSAVTIGTIVSISNCATCSECPGRAQAALPVIAWINCLDWTGSGSRR